ncbi:MAG TPA: TauD/TfdA family dioxygenase [Thermoanaerobaculia bacterium]|jgi:alpha-ketoglutarate-dependent taurine dioxygenase|nr:TauD/TfdA family dioxygenase [Thermoanaerobaculia bacterium]
MNEPNEQAADPSALKRMGAVRRRAVSVSGETLVKTGPLFPDSDLPLLVEPNVAGLDLVSWAGTNRELVEENLQRYGGILFRGFNVQDAAGLEAFVRAVSGSALEYKERSSPRSAVSGNIYTSTDYPPEYPIFLHNENSYQSVWPLKIFFFCHTVPGKGGETPIADCRRVLQRISPEVRDRFMAKKWMYVRNFGDGFGLPWQTVFQTSDKARVEEYCAEHGIEVEWKPGDRLRTRAIRTAVARHPKTGAPTWFNHATFFHVSTLEPAIREALLEEFSEDELPATTYYGDHTSIEPEALDHLRECYRQETLSFPWQKGDLLMLDNMLVAHGRAPYAGERKILVGMAEPIERESIQSTL